MCGRFTSDTPSDVARAFDARPDPQLELRPRYNIAPTQNVPIVVLRDAARVVAVMRWGLLAIRPGVKTPLINIRRESLGSVRVFADALAGRRCLVPCTGFYEWNAKQPIWFHPHGLAAFAGIFTGDAFAIITTPPNELVAPIHDRMPCVLSRNAWGAWLDPSFPADGARELLVVPEVGDWTATAVSSRVNSVANDDERCIAPANAPVQGLLF